VVQVSDEEVAAYYRTHEAEFTRGGDAIPFEEAVPAARQRASSERRSAIVGQWIRDLRSRAAQVDRKPRAPMSFGAGDLVTHIRGEFFYRLNADGRPDLRHVLTRPFPNKP